MGYYVNYSGSICIPEDKEERILQALKDLNHKHSLKHGGRHPQSGDPYEDRWFSWMPPRYHETVESVDDVLGLLGFDIYDVTDGCRQVYYDSKIGSEEHFLETIVENGGTVALHCSGEDDSHWKYETVDGRLVTREGRIVYE